MGPFAIGTLKALLLAQSLQGTVTGTVRDAETREPIAGAVVTLVDPGRASETDIHGRYTLREVPSGSHPLSVRLIGYVPRTLHALVPEHGRLEIDFTLLPEPVRIETLDVRAKPGTLGWSDGTAFPDRQIAAASLRYHPLLSEPDALEAMGGGDVSLRPESASGVNVRGGASDETGYRIDGIPVFSPYHAAGLTSGWNSDALSTIRLESTAPPPNTLSGSIEAITRAPGTRLRGQGSTSTSQSRITFDGPLPVGRARGDGALGAGFLVSLRSGLPDAFAPRDESSYMRGETGDWLWKVETPAAGGRLELLGYGNENELSTAVAVTEGGAPVDSRRNDFEWISRSIGAQWKRSFANVLARVAAWRADGDVGSSWAAASGPVDMAGVRRDRGFAVGADYRTGHTRTLGEVRLEEIRTTYRVLSDSTPAPEWSVAAGAPAFTALARHERSFGKNVTARLGGGWTRSGGRSHFGPHAELQWSPTRRLRMAATIARTHQLAQSVRNAESVVGNVFPADIYLLAESTPGAAGASVPVARSQQAVFSLSFLPSDGFRLGTQAYARTARGLLLVAPGEGEPFATTPDALTVGSGTARGVSLEAEWTRPRYRAILSYALQEIRITGETSSYVPEIAASQVVQGGLVFFPGASTTVRLGVQGALGRRATPVVGAFEWEAHNLLDRGSEFGGSPQTAGELGEMPLPGYYRVDLGARKEWRVAFGGRDATIALFASATNLLGRKNVLNYARDPATGALSGIEMRPRAPLVVGIDWGF